MIEFGKVTGTQIGQQSRTVTAQLRLTGSEGDDDRAEPYDGAEVIQPLGVVSRPMLTPTTEVAYVRVGDEVIALGFVDKGRDTIDSLQEGELRLEAPGKVDAKIQLLPNGDIVLRAGTLKVARVTDPVNIGTLSGTAGPYPVNFVFVPATADGPSSGSSAGLSIVLTAVVSNAGGATNVKA